jgi:hypothetical protein
MAGKFTIKPRQSKCTSCVYYRSVSFDNGSTYNQCNAFQSRVRDDVVSCSTYMGKNAMPDSVLFSIGWTLDVDDDTKKVIGFKSPEQMKAKWEKS